MPRCTRCGRDNAVSAATCSACGSALSPPRTPVVRPGAPRPTVPRAATPGPGAGVRCAACGAAVPPGFKFCGACGAPAGSRAPTAPKPRGPRARVSLLAQDGAIVSTWPLMGTEMTVGTASEARLTDAFAAPLQGRIVVQGNGLYWRSEDTLNGTFVLIRRDTPLKEGDELRVGRQLMRVERQPTIPKATEALWGSPDPGYRFRLVQLLAGGVEGDVFPLQDGENLVGRSAGDLSFPTDGYVSSRHAAIVVQDDRLVLQDLGSSNGTFVRMSRQAPLEPGDLLLIGEQLLRVDP